MAKAVGCISGGLDSTLAARLIQRLGVEVVGLHVLHLWHAAPADADQKPAAVREAESRGIRVHLVDATEADLAIVRHPEHGFGKRMNPCLDCRIWTLRKAREIMDAEAADFIFTGEVLGQRPMSQHRGALRLVEREGGVEDILLRPLSAKLLEPTRPEREGLVDREQLLDISGRSRRRQMALAAEFGITEYATPAGGCLLTDPGFAFRLKELIGHEGLSAGGVELLKVGRHFRLADGSRIVVGRHLEDNLRLERLFREGDVRIEAATMPGPTTLLRQAACGLAINHQQNVRLAAALTLRYGKTAPGEAHPVRVMPVGGEEHIIEAAPADEAVSRGLIISPEQKQ